MPCTSRPAYCSSWCAVDRSARDASGSRKHAKAVAKPFGSMRRNERENLSWLGKRLSGFKKERNKASRSAAKSAISTQVLAHDRWNPTRAAAQSGHWRGTAFSAGIDEPSKPLISLVGAAGFELATPCSQSKCSTRLSYAPNQAGGFAPFGATRKPLLLQRAEERLLGAAALRPSSCQTPPR